MKRIQILFYLMTAFFMSGCIVGVSITTDQKEYALGESITATLTNRNQNPVYVNGCNNFLLQQSINGVWKTVDELICIHNNAQEIMPGDFLELNVNVETVGSYRVLYTVALDCDLNSPISEESCERVSEMASEFRVADLRMCPMNYDPVCGTDLKPVVCVTTPCDPIEVYKTYGNSCGAVVAGSDIMFFEACGEVEGLPTP